jgi:hypothetical protein
MSPPENLGELSPTKHRRREERADGVRSELCQKASVEEDGWDSASRPPRRQPFGGHPPVTKGPMWAEAACANRP